MPPLSPAKIWLVRDLRPRCPDERLVLRAAVRVARALDPVLGRVDLRAEVFRPVLGPPVLGRPISRRVLRPPIFRPLRLADILHLAPVLERADAADRQPPFADAFFFRPPPPLRPDFDF